jgi:hypothetical protein
MTFEEAANRLGRSKRSVHTYAKQGFIKRSLLDGKVVLQRDDVEQLAIELGADLPAMNRKTFFQLQSRIQKLEEQMALVQQMWGIQEKPLHPSDTEASGIYRAAIDALNSKAWSIQEMEMWVDLFLRFDEQTLAQVSKTALISNPWDVFTKLALGFSTFVGQDKGFSASLPLQALFRKIETARKRLKAEAVLWIESHRGLPMDLKAYDTPKEGLLRKLGSKSA